MTAIQAAQSSGLEPTQKRESAMFGIWLLIGAETVLFGSLFTLYTVLRLGNMNAFRQASRLIGDNGAVWATAYILLSTYAAAMVMRAVKKDNHFSLVGHLTLILIAGFFFLGNKYHEFSRLIKEGLLWPGLFSAPGFTGQGASQYSSIFFLINGLLLIHMVIGLFIAIRLTKRAMLYQYSSTNDTPIQLFARYWQLGVLVWFILFPLFYLI
ncbi:MAG: hypothetical protein HQK83_07350 [Fibrobacteria bacterium]|nr:hypothetical protein [Fibrobacteria bacterium]